MRNTSITRQTSETKITLSLNLDGSGIYKNNTGCGFLNHMLDLFAKHARFDLEAVCQGDTEVDYHHTVEDVALVLGKAFAQAVGDGRGICRYGDIVLPMDEVLMLCAVDVGGRSVLGYDVVFSAPKIGDFDTELVQEFMSSFVRNANINLHFKQLACGNAHHTSEAMFKAMARALKAAVAIDAACADEMPSTKGML